MLRWLDPRTHGFESEALQRPSWIMATLYGLLLTFLICAPTWPGLMSFDSLLAYRQSVTGVETAIWPPMHTYLLYPSRILTGGPGGLFALQTFLLFFSAALIISVFVRGMLAVVAGLVIFAAAFWIFPTLVGTAIVIWKDVPVVTFCLLGMALWFVGLRSQSPVWFGLAVFCVFIATGTRWNALPLYLPWLLLMCAFPWSFQPGIRQRLIAGVAVLVALIAAVSTGIWRLPDFKALPPAGDALVIIQKWDLVGMSACEHKNLIPQEAVIGDLPTAEQLQDNYDPRHVNITMGYERGVTWRPETGDMSAAVKDIWAENVVSNADCYLAHRLAVHGVQMGLFDGPVFYPSHGGIDANEFGLKSADPEKVGQFVQWIRTNADESWRRAWVLHVIGVIAFVVGLFIGVLRPYVVVLFLGIIGSEVLLFFLAPAADARYVFPTNVMSALLLALVVPAIIMRLATRFQSEDDGDDYAEADAIAPILNPNRHN